MNYSLYTAQRLGQERRRDARRLADQEQLARLAGSAHAPVWRLYLASLLHRLADIVAAQPADMVHQRYSGSARSSAVTG